MTIQKRLMSPLALCLVGAALALGACGDDDEDVTATNEAEVVVTDADGNTTTTTTTDVRDAESGAPGDGPPTVESCIALWNGGNNLQNQTVLAGKVDGDDAVINVSPNVATDPPTCVVTLIEGTEATEWAQAAGQDFPFATPAERDAAELDAERKADNADPDNTGKLSP